MFGIIALSLSLLVVLAGMFMLAKSKKDSLGNLYIFSSYAAIIIGVFLFFGSIVGGMCMMRCHSQSSSCYMQGHAGGQCSMQSCKGMACGMHGNAGCSHGKMSSCTGHGGGKSCSMKGHGMKHHHMMTTGDDENVKVEIEVESNEDHDEAKAE